MFERRSGAPEELRCLSAGVVRLMNFDSDSGGALIVREVLMLIVPGH